MNKWQKLTVTSGLIIVAAATVFFLWPQSPGPTTVIRQATEPQQENLGTAAMESSLSMAELTQPDNPLLAPAGTVAGETAAMRLYRNSLFDFELSYPESLGELIVEEFTSETVGVCVKAGTEVYGTFSKNKHLDFGITTPDFSACPNTANPIFSIKNFTVSGSSITLDFGDFRSAMTVSLVATIPTASPGITAYVFNNNIDKHSQGEVAAVVSSPHPRLGHPVFRTHNINQEQGIELLRKVIAP